MLITLELKRICGDARHIVIVKNGVVENAFSYSLLPVRGFVKNSRKRCLEPSKAPPSVVEEIEMKARAKIMRATRYASKLL